MNAKPILRYFPDWYRTVHLDPSSELIEMQLKCIGAVTNALGPIEAAEFVDTLLLDSNRHDSKRDALALEFSRINKAFPASNNKPLVNVMIAGCIAALIDHGGASGLAAALKLKTMTLAGKACQPELPHLLEAAIDFLTSAGADVRTRANAKLEPLPLLRLATLPKVLKAVAIADVPENQWPVVNAAFKTISTQLSTTASSLGELSAVLDSTRTDLLDILKALDSRHRDPAVVALQEETQVLWWLFGDWCNEAGCRFPDLQMPGGALIIGREFASLMNFAPGHPRAAGILAKALPTEQKSVALAEVISSSPLDWRKRIAAQSSSVGTLTPIMFAVARSVESPDSSWHMALQSTTGWTPDTSASLVDWALQYSDELLLQRVLGNAAT